MLRFTSHSVDLISQRFLGSPQLKIRKKLGVKNKCWVIPVGFFRINWPHRLTSLDQVSISREGAREIALESDIETLGEWILWNKNNNLCLLPLQRFFSSGTWKWREKFFFLFNFMRKLRAVVCMYCRMLRDSGDKPRKYAHSSFFFHQFPKAFYSL